MFEQALAQFGAGRARLGLIATFEASIASMAEELLQLAGQRAKPCPVLSSPDCAVLALRQCRSAG